MTALRKAMIDAAKEMPSLKKEDRNQHGNYSYVSIDAYYETVAKVALTHGITWRIREEDRSITEINGKAAYLATYAFDVMHKDGDVEPDYFKTTIIHPMQGAQTAGSAMSYADKLFMRTSFHIVTGENDADDTSPSAFDLEPQKKPAFISRTADPVFDLDLTPPAHVQDVPPPESAEPDLHALPNPDMDGWPFVGKMVETFISDMDLPTLTEFWRKNDALFHRMKQEAKLDYDVMLAKFTARKKTLTPKKEKA